MNFLPLVSHFSYSAGVYQSCKVPIRWAFKLGVLEWHARGCAHGRWKWFNLRMMRSVRLGQLQGELGAGKAKRRQLLPAEAHYAKGLLSSRIIT